MSGSVTALVDRGTLTTDHFSAAQADALTRDQTRHLHVKTCHFNFVIGDTPTTKEVIIHVAQGAGVVRRYAVGLNDTGTSTSVAFELKKNGTTILSAAKTIAHTDTDKTSYAATISISTYVAGDIFSALETVSSSTGATGPFAVATFDELSP